MSDRRVHQIKFRPGISLKDLAEEMEKTGVLGAGAFGQAQKLLSHILSDKDYTVFLSLAGPLVASGLRSIIADLIQNEYVHVVVPSGANIVHDLVEAFGHKHLQGSFAADDVKLAKEKKGRIGNILVSQGAFETLETKLKEHLPDIIQENQKITPSEFLHELGSRLKDKKSWIYQASKKNVPIHAPGLLDSMLGLHLWLYNQKHPIDMDFLGDMSKLSSLVFDSKKTAAIILGGGLPKHYTLAANILRDGLDAALQITTGEQSDGSLSGANLTEAISWNKLKSKSITRQVTLRGDVTMIFPLLLAATLND
jgi:deoxyhypusine synthase